MPRQSRLDAPGALHHVIGRGINGVKIFNNTLYSPEPVKGWYSQRFKGIEGISMVWSFLYYGEGEAGVAGYGYGACLFWKKQEKGY